MADNLRPSCDVVSQGNIGNGPEDEAASPGTLNIRNGPKDEAASPGTLNIRKGPKDEAVSPGTLCATLNSRNGPEEEATYTRDTKKGTIVALAP